MKLIKFEPNVPQFSWTAKGTGNEYTSCLSDVIFINIFTQPALHEYPRDSDPFADGMCIFARNAGKQATRGSDAYLQNQTILLVQGHCVSVTVKIGIFHVSIWQSNTQFNQLKAKKNGVNRF